MADNNITLDDLKKDAIPAAASEEVTEEVKEAPETPAKPVGLGTSSEAGGFKAVNIGNIVADMPKNTEEKPPEERDILGTAVYKLDDAVERYKQDMYENVVKPAQEYNEKIFEQRAEREAEAAIDAEIDAVEGGNNIKIAPKSEDDKILDEIESDKTESEEVGSYNFEEDSDEEFEKMLGLDDEDIEDATGESADDENQLSEEEVEEANKELKEEINSMVTPITKTRDLTSFKIATKPINMSMVLKKAAPKTERIGDWVLLNAKRAFSASALVGEEVEKFNINRTDRNRLNILKEMYSIIYEHIIDDNKPKTFEAWLKTIAIADSNDLVFGIYRATFQDSNIIPHTCPECKKPFMSKVNIEDMIEYPDEETKKLVADIRSGDTTSSGTYEQELVQISDDFVFGIRPATLYSTFIEGAVLDEAFINKYGDVIDMIANIDNIYYINDETHELVPVDYKPDPTNFARSVRKKILSYYKIFKSITPDQYSQLVAKVNEMNLKLDKYVNYVTPECTCPKCGAKLEKTATDPLSMLFIRHQLVRFSHT